MKMERTGTNALVKVRKVFLDGCKPMTLTEIREQTGLKSPEVSMALCHLRKHRYVTRQRVANATLGKARKTVWSYEYHPDRVAAIAD